MKTCRTKTITKFPIENNTILVWGKILCTPFIFSELYLILLGDWFAFIHNSIFEILKCLENTPAIFHSKYTAPWLINQSSIGATNTAPTKAIAKTASPSHRSLFYVSRTTAQNPIGFVSAREGNPPLHDRAQNNFRLATVWNKRVWFNTDSTLILVGVYALCTIDGFCQRVLPFPKKHSENCRNLE